MAEAVLSAVLPLIIEKLVSETFNNVAIYKEIGAEIEKWHKWLTRIQDVLADAAQKEITSQSVKRWLNDLQDLVYDIDDVLDGWAIDAMHREITHDSESGPVASTSMVRKLIPSCCTNFSPRIKMHENLAIIDARLEFLFKQKDNLGLIVKEETRPKNNNNNNRRFQSSVVDPSEIVGRQDEEQALVQQLLGDDHEPRDKNYSIVPIYGIGGMGKTTLARLLYNKDKVKEHFELMGWVCISDVPLDISGRTKEILSSMGGEVNKQLEDFNKLHEALRDLVKGKRFLLVLDDIWSVSFEDWKKLVEPFYTCAPGSKIIITTRKHQLLKRLVYNPLNNPLQGLSDDDALSLLARHALGEKNFDSHSSLKPHAKDIVKKCGGLPLALIALGGLLGTKRYEAEHWKEVSNSEIWELKDEDEVLPALRLSYQDLSAPLKQLFAYCSLFPKVFLFDKEELVKLWMAEGFLHLPALSDSTEECLGRDYFDELLSRSFFQLAPNNKSRFVMHDLMNDLAMHVARQFFVRLDVEEKKHYQGEMLERYRHMSFSRERYAVDKKFEAFERAKKLRTFLTTDGEVKWWERCCLSNNILVDLLGGLKLLRVLSLAGFEISEVPESVIDTLKHLRYLNLSHSNIKRLPENVCNLCHLQTLILFGCYSLAKLPNSFSKLKNLQHFDVRDTLSLKEMPLGIDELKRLQTLSKIIIGGEHGFKLNKLKEFKNLCGNISIMGLDKVQNATYAREANLSHKRISELKLVWSDVFDGSRNEVLEEDVLNELRPHNDCLEQLEIVSYGGLEFPTWVGGPSFLQLKSVSIRDCKKCTSLPPLGQLPALTKLYIEGLVTVEVVDMELLGTSIVFHSLEILSFKSMAGWKTWSTDNGDVFPCLQQLYIKNCTNLVEVSLKKLRKLDVLEIDGCDSGVLRSLVQVASNVTKLTINQIYGLNDMVWKDVTEYLGAVKDLNISNCKEIRYLWESEVVASKVLVNLKVLTVRKCDDLVSLGEKEDNSCRSMTSLITLIVYDNLNMERCCCPDNIETLQVINNSSIRALSFPSGQKLKWLDIFNCPHILEREWGGQKMPKLEVLQISEWHNLKSITELKYLVHLKRLWIENCKSLESFPDNELPYLTSLKELWILNCPSMNASFYSSGMWPPKLQSLWIGDLKKPISEWGPLKFPTSLFNLELNGGGNGVSDCRQISHLLPSSLTTLRIFDFEKLETVSMGLQHLTSLQHLACYYCPNMMDLPEKLVPSLLSLEIRSCPKLKERCSEGGDYTPLISHIPVSI